MEYFHDIFGDFYSHALTILFLFFLSFLIRHAVIISGQNWLKTYSHTVTMLLLPVITYTITTVIAGNIALSLGMVGALSIVRFRNPVKSPYELALYFLFITLGVSASVSTKWMFFLSISSLLIILIVKLFDFLHLKIKKYPLFNISFSEGNALHVLEVTVEKPIPNLMSHEFLIAMNLEPGNANYRFAHSSADRLLHLMKDLNTHYPDARISYLAP